MTTLEMEALNLAWRYGPATGVVRRGPPFVPGQVSRLALALSRIAPRRR